MITYLAEPINVRAEIPLWMPQIYRERADVSVTNLPPVDGYPVYAIMEIARDSKVSPITADYPVNPDGTLESKFTVDTYFSRVVNDPIYDSYEPLTSNALRSIWVLIRVVDGKIRVNANTDHYLHGYLYGREAATMYHQDTVPSQLYVKGRSNYQGQATTEGTDGNYVGNNGVRGYAELPAGFVETVSLILPIERTYKSPINTYNVIQGGACFMTAINAPAVIRSTLTLLVQHNGIALKNPINLKGIRFLLCHRLHGDTGAQKPRSATNDFRFGALIHPVPVNKLMNAGRALGAFDLVPVSKSGEVCMTYIATGSTAVPENHVGYTVACAAIVAVACVEAEKTVTLTKGSASGLVCVKVPKDPYRVVAYSVTKTPPTTQVNLSEIDFRLSGSATKLSDSRGGAINNNPADVDGMFLIEDITTDERARGATLPVLIYVKNSGAVAAQKLALSIMADNLPGVTVRAAVGYYQVNGIEPVKPREGELAGLEHFVPYADNQALRLPPLGEGDYVGVWLSLDLDYGLSYNNLSFRLKLLQEQ